MTKKINLFIQHSETNLRKKIHELQLPDNSQLIGKEDVWLTIDYTSNVNPDLNSGKTKPE